MTDIQNVKTYIGGGKKHASISAIRFIAMCSIIACHFCQYYGSEWAWWLNVGVQVFFIISGFLYGTKAIEEPIGWLKKQFKKILIPYYIFLIFAVVGYILVAPDKIGVKNIVAAVFTVGQIKGIGHLWFVSNILFCYLITPYLAALRDYLLQKNLFRTILVATLILGVYSLIGIITNDYFRPGRIDCYILGYFTATLCERYGHKKILWCFWLSLIPCTLSNVVYCYLHYTKGLAMDGMLAHITDFSHMFLGYSLSMLMMILLRNIKQSKVLQFSDKYSYEIYLVHQLFILSPLTLLVITDNNVLNIGITTVVILATGILLKKMNISLHAKFLMKSACMSEAKR